MNRSFKLSDFDAVAFDVEGTLSNSIPLHHETRLAAFTEHGLGHITKEQHALGPTYGSTSDVIAAGILHAAGEIERPDTEHPLVQQIVKTRLKLFDEKAQGGFDEQPGATDFVKTIARHFPDKVALVTAGMMRWIEPFMVRFGLDTIIQQDLIICSEVINDLGLNQKPAPDPYMLAKKRLGATRLLVFEDTIPGITAAKRAGAVVIAMSYDKHSAERFASAAYPPDAVAMDYAQARKFLGV